MRKTTIVVAILAATVASANAAPTTERLARGLSVHTKSQVKPNSSIAGVKTSERIVNTRGGGKVPSFAPKPELRASAGAFTSARNAGQAEAPAPQAKVETRRAAAQPKREASRKAVRAAAKAERRVARRTASRKIAVKTDNVALQREIDIPAVAGSVDRSAAAAPTGSIPSMVTQMARKAGVSPALAHAVVKVESRYQPRATGPGGYIGLMQLSYQTAKGMGFRGSRQALYEPRANLTYGMKYLAGAVAKSGGSTCAAVSKYQGGHGVRGVTRAGAVYCAKVKRFMAQGVPAGGGVTADARADAPKS